MLVSAITTHSIVLIALELRQVTDQISQGPFYSEVPVLHGVPEVWADQGMVS